jgi:hypothetical protein
VNQAPKSKQLRLADHYAREVARHLQDTMFRKALERDLPIFMTHRPNDSPNGLLEDALAEATTVSTLCFSTLG